MIRGRHRRPAVFCWMSACPGASAARYHNSMWCTCVVHVRDAGWAGQRNGALLRLMLGAGFEVSVTVDRNLEYQQNTAGAGVAVVVLLAHKNRLQELLPLMPRAAEAIAAAAPGTVTRVAG